MNDDTKQAVTQLLERMDHAERESLTRLFPQIYEDLRRIAGQYMARQSKDHTLQPTALVNEAFLKIRGGEARGQEHALALAAVAMRSILVDHARARNTLKRGEGAAPLSLEVQDGAERGGVGGGGGAGGGQVLSVLELDDLLGRLQALDARRARVVELRFFGGLTNEEIAAALGVARSTVAEDWAVARAWLRTQLRGGREGS